MMEAYESGWGERKEMNMHCTATLWELDVFPHSFIFAA
jgi:hypothetical protein